MKTILFALLVTLALVCAMEHHKFEKCDVKGFCNRLRAQTDESSGASKKSHYIVVKDSIQANDKSFSAILRHVNAVASQKLQIYHDDLILTIEGLEHGVYRMRIREKPSEDVAQLATIWEKEESRRRSTKDVLLQEKVVPKTLISKQSSEEIRLTTDSNTVASELQIVLGGDAVPMQIIHLVNGNPLVVFNSKSLLTVESIIRKANPPASIPQEDNANVTISYSGESALGLDFTFANSKHVFGIPERAADVMLKPTRGNGVSSEPYRMYNLDVFRYELDNPIGLYGVVPMLQGISPKGTSAVLVLNPSETFVDISSTDLGTNSHWISETGIVDVFFIPGPTPRDVLYKYAHFTGFPTLPQLFSLGHHQCRWNYKDEDDVKQVDAKFDEHNIPYDVLWLDIEHTDDKKYFTWDSHYFPNPEQMINKIAAKGRKMVTISDPHIKRSAGYHVHDEATAKGYYVKSEAGTADYEGSCWPGQSSWLDYLNPEVRSFYASLYSFSSYKGSTPALYTWIDMNEPSVFSGPEVTMSKDAKHINGIEHREVHNQYGFYQGMATYQGHLERHADQNDRPFILTRSFFAGSQRYVFVWTGDNEAKWDHLDKGQAMLITMGLSGMPYIGADVGGFFDNPETQLLVRWYQAGSFYPFFRAHAHIETQRREPWLFGDENTALIRSAIIRRYRLLPYYYTLAYQTYLTATPILRPLFFEYPEQASLYDIQNAFLIGKNLLVKPVVTKDATTDTVVLPSGDNWYLFDDHLSAASSYTGTIQVDTPIDFVPVYQRAGSIIPLKFRLRRSSTQMIHDPVTLQIAPNAQGKASGELYHDDGKTFNYRKGEFIYRQFTFENNVIKCSAAAGNSSASADLVKNAPSVERIIVFTQAKPERVVLATAEQAISASDSVQLQQTIDFEFDTVRRKLVIRKPNVSVAANWEIRLIY